MRKSLILAPLLILTFATSLFAQGDPYANAGKTPAELMFVTDPLKIDKKEPSFWFWNRPSKDTPAEQLAYAEELLSKQDFKGAAKAYNQLVRTWHSAPEALDAQVSLARCYNMLQDYKSAYNENIYLLAYFMGQFDLEPVLTHALSQADYLSHNRPTFFGIDLASNDEYREDYERIVHFVPRWYRVPEILERIALLYEADENYSSAITIYDRIIVQWNQAPNILAVVYQYCQACRHFADKNTQDLARLLQLENLIKGAELHYPQHPSIEQIKAWREEVYILRRDQAYTQADYYDTKAHNYKAARLAYQQFLIDFPNAPQAPQIQQRIAQLTVPQSALGQPAAGTKPQK